MPGYGKTEQTVLTLMDGLLGKGHHLFTDRFYTSIPLLEKLGSEYTSLTGTIVKNRRFLPPAVKCLKMKKGETKAFQYQQNLCLVWRDKRYYFTYKKNIIIKDAYMIFAWRDGGTMQHTTSFPLLFPSFITILYYICMNLKSRPHPPLYASLLIHKTKHTFINLLSN